MIRDVQAISRAHQKTQIPVGQTTINCDVVFQQRPKQQRFIDLRKMDKIMKVK